MKKFAMKFGTALAMTALSASALASDLPALPATPAIFHEAGSAAVSERQPAQLGERWWTIFNDPILNDLVARADAGNSSIQEATARLSKARAQLRGAAANRLPQIGISAGVSQQAGPLINAAGGGGTLLNVGANLSYEVDLFGRLSKTQRAARLDTEASQELLRGAKLLAQADTVQTYFELRELAAERGVLQDAANGAAKMLGIMEGRFGRGIVAELDVVRARGEQISILSELSSLDQRAAAASHALAFLIGEAPSDFQLQALEIGAPPVIPADVPSVVLARRADVVAAERGVTAAALRLKIARTAWFPSLNLTASGGVASSALGELLKSSAQNFGVGLLLSLPIFDGGRRKASIQGAHADLELATVEYRSHILNAFRDVDDQLSAVRLIGEQAALASANAESSARATTILEARFANGLVSRLEVLDAQRTELKARRANIQARYARYVVTISLIRALGGGWITPS